MKQILKGVFILLTTIVLMNSCKTKYGSGNIVSEERRVPDFHGVSVSGGIEVELSQGTQRVLIEADDNLVKFIKTKVDNGKLVISTDIKSNIDGHMKVIVSTPDIDRLSASSGAIIRSAAEINDTEYIKINASSSGEVKVKVDVPEVEMNASSGGEIDIAGRTRSVKATSSSGSVLNAGELLSETSEVSASSGGRAEVHSSISFDAKASSGGIVTLKGNGKVEKSASSGGVIETIN